MQSPLLAVEAAVHLELSITIFAQFATCTQINIQNFHLRSLSLIFKFQNVIDIMLLTFSDFVLTAK